jgi:hypothetical protein
MSAAGGLSVVHETVSLILKRSSVGDLGQSGQAVTEVLTTHHVRRGALLVGRGGANAA